MLLISDLVHPLLYFHRKVLKVRSAKSWVKPRASLLLEVLEDRSVPSTAYVQTNLVSDIPGFAQTTDLNLVNPWGIVANSDGSLRIADNGPGLSTLYTGNGTSLGHIVTIPPPTGSTSTATPSGEILNTTDDFVIHSGRRSAPSTYLFATEDGTISGYNQQVNANNAILGVDNSASGAVYKGLAIGSNSKRDFIFAANFHAGTIDVFDANFHQVNTHGAFVDPNLPPPAIGTPGFAPFDVKNIGGTLFVTYALQNSEQHDDVAGTGNGFIDEFDTSGHLITRFASQGALNSPWGMVVAPSNFGTFSSALLVGNFGDSHVSAYNIKTGAFLGQLSDASGTPLVLTGGFQGSDTKGLWGLAFGNSSKGGSATLFFTSGINDEGDGLLGSVKVANTKANAAAAALATALADSANSADDTVWSGIGSHKHRH